MITTAQLKGPRQQQEDRFVVATVTEGTLLAVMDGHGGVEVAACVAKHLPAVWSAIRPEYEVEPKLRQVVAELHEATKHFDAGSTLSLVLIPTHEKVAYVAVLGDSPVIIRQPNGVLHISPDHNVRTNPTEAQAATERGGVVLGGYVYAATRSIHDSLGAGLQMNRALGDAELDSVLDRTPDVYSVPLGDFVLVASDGLFDPAHTEDLKLQAHSAGVQIDRGADAQALVTAVWHPKDNITAILWKRKPRPGINLSPSQIFGYGLPKSEAATT